MKWIYLKHVLYLFEGLKHFTFLVSTGPLGVRLTGAYLYIAYHPKGIPRENLGLRISIIKKEVGNKNNQSPKACILE